MMMYFFFFKQKTAYEMRISDWSSDVCSSDLHDAPSSQSDIVAILRSVAATLELAAARRGMRIEVVAEALPPVVGERDELAQVFQNLLDNAVKYGEDNTVVRVTARRLAKSGAGERRLGRAGLKRSEEHTSELQSLMRISYA